MFWNQKIIFKIFSISNNQFHNYKNNYINTDFKIFFIKCLSKKIWYLNLKQIILDNKSKFYSNYLLFLNNLIFKINQRNRI